MTIQNQLDRSCMIPQPVTFLFFLSKDLASGSPLNNTQDGYIWSIIQVHADWFVPFHLVCYAYMYGYTPHELSST